MSQSGNQHKRGPVEQLDTILDAMVREQGLAATLDALREWARKPSIARRRAILRRLEQPGTTPTRRRESRR